MIGPEAVPTGEPSRDNGEYGYTYDYAIIIAKTAHKINSFS